jgi:hypothetical protein
MHDIQTLDGIILQTAFPVQSFQITKPSFPRPLHAPVTTWEFVSFDYNRDPSGPSGF